MLKAYFLARWYDTPLSKTWRCQVDRLSIVFKFGLLTRFGMGYEEYGALPADNAVAAMSSFARDWVTQVQMLRAFFSCVK